MAAQVYRLASHEDAVLDRSRIEVLRQSLGPERCREVVEEVVFHLTDRMTRLEAAIAAGDVPEAVRLAARLASLSEQVGLADLARVSRDLGACLDAQEPNATAAVAARLARLGEESLFSVIVLTDQTAL
jgi:HPt (histidine-containing phosphotransfer) domain-containing protein